MASRTGQQFALIVPARIIVVAIGVAKTGTFFHTKNTIAVRIYFFFRRQTSASVSVSDVFAFFGNASMIFGFFADRAIQRDAGRFYRSRIDANLDFRTIRIRRTFQRNAFAVGINFSVIANAFMLFHLCLSRAFDGNASDIVSARHQAIFVIGAIPIVKAIHSSLRFWGGKSVAGSCRRI